MLTRERLGQVASGENQTALGMTFSLVGEPNNGDVITLHPKDRPAATFEVVVKDIGQIATAATMRQMPGASNASGAEASLQLIPLKERPTGFQFGQKLRNEGSTESRRDVFLKTDSARPVVQIERGTVGAEILFGIAKDSDQRIQILTREGVHVAGTAALTTSEANALMALDTGFGDGAYSDTYLNKNGSAAYLDTTVQFGVLGKSETTTVPTVNPDTGLRTTADLIEPARVTSKKFRPQVPERWLPPTPLISVPNTTTQIIRQQTHKAT